MISANRLTNANVYLEGGSQLGRAEEVTLPELVAKSAEHKAIGLVGSLELPSGIDKMSMKIKWNSVYPEVLRQTANIYQALRMQVRSSLEVYSSEGREEEVPVVVHVRGTFKKTPLIGGFKQHDNVENEQEVNVTYVMVEIGGEEIVEIDVLANIYKVDGEDLLENYRRNLGI